MANTWFWTITQIAGQAYNLAAVANTSFIVKVDDAVETAEIARCDRTVRVAAIAPQRGFLCLADAAAEEVTEVRQVGVAQINTALGPIDVSNLSVPLTAACLHIMSLSDGQVALRLGDDLQAALASETGIADINQITGFSTAGSQAAQSGTEEVESTTVCIVEGARIAVEYGETLIEDLSVGDKILTADRGYLPIRWIGKREIARNRLSKNAKLWPIRIQAGSLGKNVPDQDLLVSRQHRMLVRSKVLEQMFGEEEALIAANKLLHVPGVAMEEPDHSIVYYHLALDRHEIIFANDAPTETLYLGPEGVRAVGEKAKAELALIFPEILTVGYAPEFARFIPPQGRCAKQFLSRMMRNNDHLLSGVAVAH